MKQTQATQARFEATRWTLVIQAKSPDAPGALNELCQTYWPPVYAFIRRQDVSPSDAADLTQDFFVHILRHQALSTVVREKGKFRSFLQASLNNFLNNERDRVNAKKRGGDKIIISIEAEAEEHRHILEMTGPEDPTKVFDRRWALALIDEVMVNLEQRYIARGRGAIFERLKPYLTGEVSKGSHSALAADLGMTEGAAKVALHRLRHEFADLLRSEIRQTLANPTEQEIREEIRHLFSALGA